VNYTLELVLLPVSDVDRAKSFYTMQAGFDLLVDTAVGGDMRVVQVTPPGSSCSIGFGKGLLQTPPGSVQGLHLVVPDIVAAREELTGRGLRVTDMRHMDSGTWKPGPDPERRSYMSFADFSDPDGNGWVLQEVRRDGASA
jgi:catechol 2,3-dioxygenase-like lactoylglutathione lyase family enzyme